MPAPSRQRAETARWHTAAQVLAALRRQPDITRAAMAQQLHLSSGSATEVLARMREVRLLDEEPAPIRGRGRPTTLLRPHRGGPVVLALDLRHEDWRSALATVDGRLHEPRVHRHRSREPEHVLADLRGHLRRVHRRYGPRLRAASLAVAAAIHGDRLVQASALGWGPVDLASVAEGTGLPLLAGNDATLAGIAEARTGASTAGGTALHLIVEVGIGGTLTVAGEAVTGAHGAGGEYGHLPFGDRSQRCPCGARGCWDLDVDGRALARHLGEPEPADPRTYARAVLDRAASDPYARRAVSTVAAALGAGIAGLVNLHDPEVVTLGGLGSALRTAASAPFDAAYLDGLMAFHRARPPLVLDAAHGDDGPLRGAALVGLDHVTAEAALATWAVEFRM
ncbi:ROK family transcriptional regulator [Micromonospora sp. NPDC049559]|uniref:ROK family transcriptional regulator n=1 Tax=Micromonospora sp. NPDC049559 TaxID=3155923 RepID=UPI00341D245F